MPIPRTIPSVLPRAGDLIEPILRKLAVAPFDGDIVLALTARQFGIEEKATSIAFDPSTSLTFRHKFDAAADFLAGAGLLRKEPIGAKWRITQEGRGALDRLGPDEIERIGAAIEPKAWERRAPPAPRRIRFGAQPPRATRPAPAVAADGEIDEKARQIAGPALNAIPRLPLSRLYAMWINAEARAGSEDLPVSRASGLVLAAIAEERSRRGAADPSSAVREGTFRWPSTAAAPGGGDIGIEAEAFGMLATCGYRVGRVRGVDEDIRREILEKVFLEDLPSTDEDSGYALSWGGKGSAQRLRKLAFTIAACARNGKRRVRQDLGMAISQWEDDLTWLHDRYYVGRFTFEWPDTAVPGMDHDGEHGFSAAP